MQNAQSSFHLDKALFVNTEASQNKRMLFLFSWHYQIQMPWVTPSSLIVLQRYDEYNIIESGLYFDDDAQTQL